MEKQFWVYILECDNGSYYTGYTNDLARRYQSHLAGTASKYTRSFKPIAVVQCWQVSGDKPLAMQIERFIKNLSRQEKQEYITCPKSLSLIFDCKPFARKYIKASIRTRANERSNGNTRK